MNQVTMLVSARVLPAEGYEVVADGGGMLGAFAALRRLLDAGGTGECGESFQLVRLGGAGVEVSGVSVRVVLDVDVCARRGVSAGLGEALDPWTSPLRLRSVPVWDGAGGRRLGGIVLATEQIFAALEDARGALEAAGWLVDFPDDEVSGHGLREIALAGALGLTFLTSSVAATVPAAEAARTEQVEQAAADLFVIHADVLREAQDPSAAVRFVVDLASQRGFLLVNGRIAVETRVCSGRTGKETPTGTFVISEKIRSGKISTIYNVPLPRWMRLTQGGIGLHVGDIKDAPASAGCVRLPKDIATVLFDHLPRGSSVEIVAALGAEPWLQASPVEIAQTTPAG